jgi:hypothetical protein
VIIGQRRSRLLLGDGLVEREAPTVESADDENAAPGDALSAFRTDARPDPAIDRWTTALRRIGVRDSTETELREGDLDAASEPLAHVQLGVTEAHARADEPVLADPIDDVAAEASPRPARDGRDHSRETLACTLSWKARRAAERLRPRVVLEVIWVLVHPLPGFGSGPEGD